MKILFYFFNLYFCSKFVLLYSSGSYDCPLPWLGFEDNCYRFVLYTVTISEAKADCAMDSATLLQINTPEENNFIINWLSINAKDGLEWFTDGIVNMQSPGNMGSVTYIWETGNIDITGQQFWFSMDARKRSGNRIVYYTDGATWGWAMFNDSMFMRPFACKLNKQYIYKINNIERDYDYGQPEIDTTKIDHGPSFILEPFNAVYDPKSQSNSISFDCLASALPLPTYQWIVYRQLQRQIVNVSDPAITITNGRLTITQPKDDKHNGLYQCIVSNPYGKILSKNATLTFGYLNDFPKSQREPIRAVSFQGVGIECIPPKTGYNSLTYSWYKDNMLNLIRSNVKWYTFVSSDGKLYFQFVTKEDSGDYTCQVSVPNLAHEGKLSVPIPFQVIESGGSTQDPIMVNSFPKAFPLSPLVGDTVRMECIAFATSQWQMNYWWNRTDKAEMPSNAHFEDYNRVMYIPNVQLSHTGRYKCTVSRTLGTSISNYLDLVVEAAPFFTIPLDNRFVDLGTTVKWRCTATGKPAVSYRWYINSTSLNTSNMIPEDGGRFEVNQNQLTIKNVQFKDAGMYQCSAINSYGERFSSAQLKVLYFPPTFKKYPVQSNTYGTQNSNVTLLCQPESSPPPSKIWSKDGSVLGVDSNPSAHISMLPNGNLFVNNVQNADEGNYTCEAANALGKASSTGLLTVLPQTTSSLPPRDLVVNVNTTAFFHCEASYNPAIDLTYDWWHNNYKIMFIKVRNLGNTVQVFTEPYYSRGTGINRGGLYINNAQFFHAGTYKCIIKSTSQELAFKARLVVNGPPGEPAGVRGSNVNATNLTLTWWPGPDHGQPTIYFIIESYNLLEGFWRRAVNSVPIVDVSINKQVSSMVTGLNPYTQYQFRVIGVNSLGEGDPSKTSPIYQTSEAPPVTYPLKLGGGGGKVGTLNITWEMMPVNELNAANDKVGYIVSWKRWDMNDDQWDKKRINDSTVSKYVVVVGTQNYYTKYNIRIQAFNPQGIGPMSPVVDIMSAEDLPNGQPVNVRAQYYNATAITVFWTPVKNTREVTGGVLFGYRINYWVDHEQDERMAIFTTIVGQTDQGLIIALRPFTWYMVNVQVVNTAGNGPKSDYYRTRTLRAAPLNSPQNVTVRSVNSNYVSLHWIGVYTTIEEEPLQGYIVAYWTLGENYYVAKFQDAGRAVTYTLGPLEHYVQYEVRVFGYSRGGDGLKSSPTLEFIIGENCEINTNSSVPDKALVYLCKGCHSVVPMLSNLSFVVMSTFVYVLIQAIHRPHSSC